MNGINQERYVLVGTYANIGKVGIDVHDSRDKAIAAFDRLIGFREYVPYTGNTLRLYPESEWARINAEAGV